MSNAEVKGMTVTTAEKVARAICEVNLLAGRDTRLSLASCVDERVERLLQLQYIVDGDPLEWGGGQALATIFMEPKGGKDDCIVPLEYYREGLEHSCSASDKLDSLFIEFVNAAVACVYKV